MQIGATYLGSDHCEFTVWAPAATEIALHLPGPPDRLLPMEREEHGYWRLSVDEAPPGTRYFFRLDGESDLPDPASCYQPDGVHRASAVLDHGAVAWSDGGWRGITSEEMILYELHVGAFTQEGTFAAVIPRLSELRRLGVTAIELMPVAQFPGGRNWGYDGVHPFAVQNTYGGPQGLKALVDACHNVGLAVVLDVVYNHLGPEGNYLREFGPYFTSRYRTPWGEAVNFDGAGSDGVRNFFLENALHWFEHYHVDALRLDAVHAIFDFSAKPFLQELAERVHDIRGGAGSSPPAHRRERPQRCAADPAAGAGGHRPRRSVERRLPPRPAHPAHRRAPGVLPRLRRRRGPRQGLPRGVRLRLALLGLPRPAPRQLLRRQTGAPVRRLLPEPRSGRQPPPG